MNREIQELLQKMQGFTQKAVKLLQVRDNERASFYFNLASSIAGQIADKVKP